MIFRSAEKTFFFSARRDTVIHMSAKNAPENGKTNCRKYLFFRYLERKEAQKCNVLLQGGAPCGLTHPSSKSVGHHGPADFLEAKNPLEMTLRFLTMVRESRICNEIPVGMRINEPLKTGIDVLTNRIYSVALQSKRK